MSITMWILVSAGIISMVSAMLFVLKAQEKRLKLQDAEIQEELNKLSKAVQDLKRDI